MQECTTKIPPVSGANRLSRLSETSKQCNENSHLLNQCDLINVSCNLPSCCRSRHTNICFLRQSYLHSFDIDSGLLGKMPIICKSAEKGVACCALIKTKYPNLPSSSAIGGFSAEVKSLDSRT